MPGCKFNGAHDECNEECGGLNVYTSTRFQDAVYMLDQARLSTNTPLHSREITLENLWRIKEDFEAGETVDFPVKSHCLLYGVAVVVHRVLDEGGTWHTEDYSSVCTLCKG